MPQVRFFGTQSKATQNSGSATSPASRKPATVIRIARHPADARAQRSPVPAAAMPTSKTCQWCGKTITRWQLFAYFREPPLCSHGCIVGWFDREM